MAEISYDIITVWNIIVFALYGIDKYRSIHGKWRISEKALIWSAVFLGAAGAYLGMRIFRHKTKKPLFNIGIPICILINISVFIWGWGK